MDPNNENSWSTPVRQQDGMSDAAPSVPPPPPEVKVRTMKSDLESMARSGGSTPQFQSVKAPTIVKDGTGAGNPKPIGTMVAIIIAAILFAAIAYFGYQVLVVQRPAGSQANPPPAAPSPQAPSPSPQGSAPSGAASFVHQSFFRTPADALLTLTLHLTAQSSPDLATFNQRVGTLVNTNVKGSFFEINVKDENGNDLAASDIMTAQDTVMIDPQYFSAHFLPDMTLFVYRDKNGLWPGYVFGLQPKDNWLFVKNDVMKLETSSKLQNIFLADPGTEASSGFKDTIESGQPARILRFNTATASSSFVYGLFHNYVILSTSEDGLTEAIGKL